MLSSSEIRSRFLEFFKKRGHTIIPSASLVPLNDPSVLFNTAGMQPLVPYLLGEPHPGGTRLADSQKCVRTVDIDEIGDNTHATFFEMLGNWSLGDYFKADAIKWSYEFLTSKDEGLGLDPSRLYVTVFGGNADAPKDTEAFEIWKNYISEHRIYFMTADETGKEPNWWSPGDNGPCGPDSEMFYDVTEQGLGDLTKEAYMAADERQDVVEIWNDVFMEYLKKDGKVVGKLEKKNVDTGSGLERITMVVQGKNNIFETDLFAPIIAKINEVTHSFNGKAKRIIADHIRTSVFLIADGVTPSNTDQGYVLRRLLRRARYYFDSIGADKTPLYVLSHCVANVYKDSGYGLSEKISEIDKIIIPEETKFVTSVLSGRKYLEKILQSGATVSSEDVFLLYSTYGYPLELTLEIAKENGVDVDFLKKKKEHQALSRQGSEQKFKGGLADTSEKTVRLHTAHHILLRALQIVLGPEVHQRGSNITQERLRIDFVYGQKMSEEQKKRTEDVVNEQIQARLPVIRTEMSSEEAEKLGAEHEFGAKYPERVSVYSIGPKEATQEDPKFAERFSIEFCGGPHVKNTSELGHFRILKEEAVSQGVRRIKAVLE